MEVTEVAQGVHQVTTTRVGWQLLVEGDGVTLVDAGWPKDYEVIVASLDAIGHTPASVEALVLTHAHVDHMGCAAEMKEKHATRVMSHEDERGLALGHHHQGMTTTKLLSLMYRSSVIMFALDVIKRGGTSVDRLTEIETFTDEAALDVPGSPVPIHTPGHTSGSTSYHLPDRGVLITGDALATCNIYTEVQRCQMMPSEFNHDQEQAVKSLERLRDVEADTVLSGHGQPFHGSPAQAVEEALALL